MARRKLKEAAEYTMNKPKLIIATATRGLLNVFLVLALVSLASLIGVGGAALWIYGRPDTGHTAGKASSPRLRTEFAGDDQRVLPKLTPVQADRDEPAQLTPARHLPVDAEMATFADQPRYTLVSYDGGRQQARLRVMTVLSTVRDSVPVPAPLAASMSDAVTPVEASDRPPLTDTASQYITDASGRVIGIDGSAGAAAEARQQQAMAAQQALALEKVVVPEVRVASPVTEAGHPLYVGTNGVPVAVNALSTNYLPTRKALPVTAEPVSNTFNVQDELSRDDDRPVLRAIPVTRATRPARAASLFGASDNYQDIGRN